jgi:DNA polymerase III epsilon subunit-like protein
MFRTDDRLFAILKAQAEVLLKPVYLDTETTGLGDGAEIVELCVLDHAGRVVVDTLVKPRRRIPPEASRLHGITGAMVANAPTWADVWPDVEAALTGQRVAIYNADYSIAHEKPSCPRRFLDTDAKRTDYICVICEICVICVQHLVAAGSRVMMCA